MSSRSIDDCKPEFALLARTWLDLCKAAGLEILVYCTLRSNTEQDALYAIGRTAQLDHKHVTNARAGQSAHNYGLALDFCPMVHGKPQWSDGPLYRNAILLAEDVGLESLADNPKFSELAHLQLANWRNHIGDL